MFSSHYAAKMRRNALKKVKTADYTILPKTEDLGAIFSNLGASGAVVLTLPSAKRGMVFHMMVETAQSFSFKAAAADHFVTPAGSDTADAASITSDKIGNWVTVICYTEKEWTIIDKIGLWLNIDYFTPTATLSGTGSATVKYVDDKIVVDCSAAQASKTITIPTPLDFKIVDVMTIHANTTACTVQVKNGASAVSDAISIGTGGTDIDKAGTIDTTKAVFAAGDDDLVIAIGTAAFTGRVIIDIERT